MLIVKNISDLRKKRREEKNKTWGFVPTMGFLHEGHFSLIRRARKENDVCAVSIFVNATQFNDPTDFEKYPKDLKNDIDALENLGADVLFMPDHEDMYPEGFLAGVSIRYLSTILEGASRPGHFDGVCVIVAKLFNVVQPDRAYFGLKDAQQLLVIRKMVEDLNFNVEVVPCPTCREDNGLAMSSRNARLTREQRQKASVLYRSLKLAEEMILLGEKDAAAIRKAMIELISGEPLAKIDIVSIHEAGTLNNIDTIKGDIVILLAVHFGMVRLIDNLFLSVYHNKLA